MNADKKRRHYDLSLPFHERHKKLLLMGAFSGMAHPAIKKIIKNVVWRKILMGYAHVCCCWMLYCPLFCGLHLIFYTRTIYEVILNSMILNSTLYTIVPLVWLIYFKGKSFGELYEHWDEYFSRDRLYNDREDNIALNYKRASKYVAILFLISLTALNPWMVAHYFDPEKTLKIPTIIPYKKESPDYEIFITSYVYPVFLQGFAKATIHLLTLLPLIWTMTELERLQESLKNIVRIGQENRNLPMDPSPLTVARVDRQLGVWIKQHQRVIMLFQKAEEIFSLPISLEMFATFMASMLTAFNFVQDSAGSDDKASQVFYYCPYMLMFALTCSYCDDINKLSGSILNKAYAEHWSPLPRKYRQSLVIIATQTQKPFRISGFKIFPCCIYTFSQILQSAYSVFNFLLAAQGSD